MPSRIVKTASETQKPRSIIRRLMVSLTLTVGLVSTLAIAFFAWDAARGGKARLEKDADEAIEHLVSILEGPLWDYDPARTAIAGEAYATDPRIVRLTIRGETGEYLFSLDRGDEAGRINRSSKILRKGRHLGTVELSLSQSSYWERITQLVFATIVTDALAIIAVFFCTGFLIRAFLRKPLGQLTTVVNSYASGNYATEAHNIPYAEFRSFGQVLGDMGGKIQGQLTEIRNLNEDLEQRVIDRTAELKAANDELEAFTYSVSHDLRAPIRHIDGFARMLADRQEAGLDEESLRLLGVIRNSSLKMGTLIDDLLTLSRLGRQAIQKTDVDFDAMVSDVWEELTSDVDSSRITFRAEPLPPAHGDARLLRQVWVNLLGNALKYSARKENPEIIVESFDVDDKPWYRVKDNGAGFDSKYADKLFGVFQRLHRSDEFSGTGVGLAIVHRIISKHGGSVQGRGEVDRGAVFEFTLGD